MQSIWPSEYLISVPCARCLLTQHHGYVLPSIAWAPWHEWFHVCITAQQVTPVLDYTEKESPHPHELIAFGLIMTKCDAIISS